MLFEVLLNTLLEFVPWINLILVDVNISVHDCMLAWYLPLIQGAFKWSSLAFKLNW